MLNKVTLIGNLGKAPEIKTTKTGTKFATLSVATTESWKDKSTGEKKTQTEWHRIVVMNQHKISYIENYFKKGSKVYVEGKIKTRKFTGDDGVDKYFTEVMIDIVGNIILLDKPDGEAKSDPESAKPEGVTISDEDGGFSFDDEIPF